METIKVRDKETGQIITLREKKVSSSENKENKPSKMGGKDFLSKQGFSPLSGVVGGDVVGTGLGVVEGVTGGLPRGIIEGVTGKDLSNYRGNILGQMAGFTLLPGQIATKAGESIKKKLVKKTAESGTRMAKSLAKNIVPKSIGKGILEEAIPGLVSGAIGGALYPQEDALNVGNRLFAGALGGGIGGAFGAIAGGTGGFLKARSLNESAKRVQDKLQRISGRSPEARVSGGDVYDVRSLSKVGRTKPSPEGFQDVYARNLNTLDETKNEIGKMFIQDTDESIAMAKKLVPQWKRAYSKEWGGRLDDIAERMSNDKVTIKVSDWSDEINTILKNEGLLGEAPFKGIPTNSVERNLLKIADKFNKYRMDDGFVDQNAGDTVLSLKDILRDKKAISQIAKSPSEIRLYNKLQKSISNVISKGDNKKYANELKQLNDDWANYAELRDFADDIIEPMSRDTKKAQSLFQKYSQRKSGEVDLKLDRGTINKLEEVEKRIGVPFLSKLRNYGDEYKLLESQVKSMEQKLARTKTVFDAVNRRANEINRSVLDKVKGPVSVVNQLKTAAYAYLLARALGQMISRSD